MTEDDKGEKVDKFVEQLAFVASLRQKIVEDWTSHGNSRSPLGRSLGTALGPGGSLDPQAGRMCVIATDAPDSPRSVHVGVVESFDPDTIWLRCGDGRHAVDRRWVLMWGVASEAMSFEELRDAMNAWAQTAPLVGS